MRDIAAVICDDEPLARRGIRQMLARHPDIAVVGEARDGRETLAALDTLAPDLVFLDVQMPELSGFDVVRARGPDRMPIVVFVTAFDEFAVRAFEVNALDYLVKPLTAQRFDATMQRVRHRLRTADAVQLSRQLASLLSTASDARRRSVDAAEGDAPVRPSQRHASAGRVAVTTADGIVMLEAAEIDRIEAENYYAAVYISGRRYLVREALSSLEQRLDPGRFLRVHRSALVNAERIREVRTSPGTAGVVVLHDGTRVPLSRRRRDAVTARLQGR